MWIYFKFHEFRTHVSEEKCLLSKSEPFCVCGSLMPRPIVSSVNKRSPAKANTPISKANTPTAVPQNQPLSWSTLQEVIDGVCLIRPSPLSSSPAAAPAGEITALTAEEMEQERQISANASIPGVVSPPALTRQRSDPPSRPHPAKMGIKLQQQGCFTMATLTPPQTNSATLPTSGTEGSGWFAGWLSSSPSSPQTLSPTSGAHCLVLDVSGSMTAEAKVTNDDGDKVSHGFTLLDIVKHATCTYVASLSASDWVRLVVYGSEAHEVASWTACTDEGKKRLDELVRSLSTRGSTNMVAGIKLGAKGFCSALPDEIKSRPEEYAMSLVVCTDGLPDNSTISYKDLIEKLKSQIEEESGAVAQPTVTAIGFGNSLNSKLLSSFSDVFLHIPDPGSVGPFIVNLVAATRSTAKIMAPSGGGMVANTARLIIEPASAVLAVPTFKSVPWRNGAAVAVGIGAIQYDQPRHILFRTVDAETPLSVWLEIGGHEVATAMVAVDVPTLEASPQDADAKVFQAQLERIAVASCLSWKPPQTPAAKGEVKALHEALTLCEGHLSAGPLKDTVKSEALLALTNGKYATWGKHYVTTLPFMLQLERRSNFRDLCLQEFGKDALGQEGLFERLSNDSELVFAQLQPPTPSRAGTTGTPTTYTSLPDEFMRGGGCFGPEATVGIVGNGGCRAVQVGFVRAGDLIVGEGGRVATVVCVVKSECLGGRAQLTRLANGLELTEWHPVRDVSTGRWRFPNMLGERILRSSTPYVYNFVLSPGHPTIVVNGVPCAALGHGLEQPVVAHQYWGTQAVIDDLKQRPGWEEGCVVLPAGRCAV